MNKSINKLKATKSKLENKLIVDLENVIDQDLNNQLNLARENAIAVKSTGQINDDIRNANEGLRIAEEKISSAKALREEAANTKSEILSNELLNRAVKLEFEAKEILKKSNRTYKSAIVIDNMIGSEIVIMKAVEDEDDKKSTQYYDLADEIEREANILELRIIDLKDSVETVKKKYRQAIVEQIADLEYKETELRNKADDLRALADELVEQEDLITETIPETVNKDVSNVEQLAVLKTNDYKSYYDEKTAADESFKNANDANKRIEQLKTEVTRKIRMAIVEGQEIDEDALEENDEIKAFLMKLTHWNKFKGIIKKRPFSIIRQLI